MFSFPVANLSISRYAFFHLGKMKGWVGLAVQGTFTGNYTGVAHMFAQLFTHYATVTLKYANNINAYE